MIPGGGNTVSYVIITSTCIYAPKGDKLSEKIKVVYDGVRKGWWIIIISEEENCAEKKCKKRWWRQGEEKIISYGVIIF